MNRRTFLLASGGLVATMGKGVTNFLPESEPTDLKSSKGAMINSFGCDLYAKLREKPGNVFISPFSISTALGMTAAGANGDTLTQMQKALHLSNDPAKTDGDYAELIKLFSKPNPNFQLTTANAIWAQKGFPWRGEFKTRVAKYGAGLREADFTKQPDVERMKVNRWVEQQTKEKIKDLLAEGTVDRSTRMVLANAIYFKGNWAEAFNKNLTKAAPFLLADGSKSEAKLMTHKGIYPLLELDHLQMLTMPYKGNELSMVIVLPKKPDGLAEFEAKLSNAQLDAWLKNSTPSRDVQVYLPKFKSETEYTLNKPLIQLGMSDAFDNTKADFSNMEPSKSLSISLVVHKAYVDVNEEGTEAAAATGVVMRLKSAAPVPQKPKIFRADHPFLYAIRHNATGTILFLGRVEKL